MSKFSDFPQFRPILVIQGEKTLWRVGGAGRRLRVRASLLIQFKDSLPVSLTSTPTLHCIDLCIIFYFAVRHRLASLGSQYNSRYSVIYSP